jgi:hypothetical protein
MYIAVGQGIPNPFTQPVGVQLGFLALALILIGIVAGWKWELAGGITSLFGMVAIRCANHHLAERSHIIRHRPHVTGSTLRDQRTPEMVP